LAIALYTLTVTRNSRSILLAVAALVCASPAVAQTGAMTVSDSLANFRLNAFSGPSTGNGATAFASSSGPGGPNYVNQAWWWARVNGIDVREFAMYQSTGVISAPTPTSIRVDYNNAFGRGWNISIAFSMRYLGGNAAVLTQNLTLTNNTGTTINNVEFFNYNNINVLGTASNDFAIADTVNRVRFIDGADARYVVDYEAIGASATSVTSTSNASGVRNLLTNSTTDNLTPGIQSSGPGDLEVASQWNHTIAAGQSVTMSVVVVIIPSPAGLAVLGLAGALALRRRRR